MNGSAAGDGARSATRSPGAFAVLAGGLIGIAVCCLLLALTGALSVRGLVDPGAVVRIGLPISRVLHDGAAAVTVGALALAAFAAPPQRRSDRDDLRGGRRDLQRLGIRSALVWLLAGVLVLIFTAADVSGTGPGSPGFGAVLVSFVTQLELGRALGISLLAVAVVLNLALLAQRISTLAWAAVIAILALLPLALGGHASGARDHMNAVDSLALHLVAVCLWVGGLAALVITARRLDTGLVAVVGRYSTLAGACFVVTAGSGVVNAGLRLGWDPAALGTGYGVLVIGKIIALTLLGAAGWWHRRHLLPNLSNNGRRTDFARFAAVEIIVMGATLGLAVTLSRSAPPVAETVDADRVVSLLGYPAPPPLSLANYFTVWYPEVLWLFLALAGIAGYLVGVHRLRRRGDTWPVLRTISWLLGCLLLIFVTCAGPGVYGMFSFSSHMLEHMSLMIIVPLPLVFGAPVTLALRALPARGDGSLGPRETLLRLVHSRVLRVLGQPVVAAVIFVSGLIIFYYTPLFQLAMFTHVGHTLMIAHFLGSGYLFIWALVGVDPGPARPSHPLRLLLLLATLSFHAFFGISLMGSASLLAPDWWAALGQTDQTALLADQQRGGALAWGLGDLPSLLLGLALIVSWVRSDTRQSRQADRRADRDGDAELARYNEELARLSRQGKP